MSKAVLRLDDDEKGETSVRTLDGIHEMNVVNESGLYNMIFTSRKPQAKAFRRWVTHAIGHGPESDLAFQRLEEAVLEGGGLASPFLRYWILSPTRLRNPRVH